MSASPGLYNSIHSAVAPACVPLQPISLITTDKAAACICGAARAGASIGITRPPHKAEINIMTNELRHRRFENFIKNIIAGLRKDQRSGDGIIHLSIPITYHPHVGSLCKLFWQLALLS